MSEERNDRDDVPREAERTREREEARGVPRGDHDLEKAREYAENPIVPESDPRASKEG